MPKKSDQKVTQKTEVKETIKDFLKNRQTQTVAGLFIIFGSIFLFTAFISFFFTWRVDQSTISQLVDKNVEAKNLLGKLGTNLVGKRKPI